MPTAVIVLGFFIPIFRNDWSTNMDTVAENTGVKDDTGVTDAEFEEALRELESQRTSEVKASHNVEATVKAKSLAQQLYQEATETPSAGELGSLGTKPHDIWTLDRMRSRGPADGDLYGDGEFLFTFKPVLGSVYCQERYAIAREYVEGDFVSYVRTQRAYAEIIYFALQGCKWPVRETVIDAETGEEVMEDVYEERPDSVGGVPMKFLVGRRPKSVPLAITLENVKKMDMDMLSDFLLAMKRSLEGKASTTP